MQASAVGAASFGARSRGRAGAATFGWLPDDWEALVAGSDVLAAAAEVVLGRRDLLDLTASGTPDALAHEVRQALFAQHVLVHILGSYGLCCPISATQKQ